MAEETRPDAERKRECEKVKSKKLWNVYISNLKSHTAMQKCNAPPQKATKIKTFYVFSFIHTSMAASVRCHRCAILGVC